MPMRRPFCSKMSRPSQDNRSLEIQDVKLRERVKAVVEKLILKL